MRKLFTALFLTGMATGLWAQVNDAPPAYIPPSERDMQRAREERSKRVDTGKVTKYRSEYGTIIEETHDQNNRVTDVRVTPGSTEIPYTMKNRSDRPVDNRPGADPRSTLDTPKFIEFSW